MGTRYSSLGPIGFQDFIYLWVLSGTREKMEYFHSCAGQTRCPVLTLVSEQSPIGGLSEGVCFDYTYDLENNTF